MFEKWFEERYGDFQQGGQILTTFYDIWSARGKWYPPLTFHMEWLKALRPVLLSKEVFGVEGGHVDLRCDSEYDPSRTLFWEVINRPYWNIQVLIKEPGRGIEIREPRYDGRLSLRDGNNLRISNLSRDDDSVDSTDSVFVGTYRCAQQGAVGTEWIIRVRPNFLFRLSGGRKLNEGRVELQKRQAGWGTICQTGWDIHDADVLCRQLGHSRATPKSVNFGPGSGPIWLSDVRCIGNESTILDCPFKLRDNDCDHDDDVGVVCDLDECYSNPCQNNGTCIDGGEHYICQCGRGWVGVHCEIREKLSSMEVTSFNWAHIEAASDSQSDTHTVKRDDTVLTKQWEQFEPSDKFRFNSGILTVLEEGDYYVYSQVYYRYNSKKSPVVSHSVMVVKTDKDNPYRFLTCWKYMEETYPSNTCFTAGFIHLFSNNSVYLHMRCDGFNPNNEQNEPYGEDNKEHSEPDQTGEPDQTHPKAYPDGENIINTEHRSVSERLPVGIANMIVAEEHLNRLALNLGMEWENLARNLVRALESFDDGAIDEDKFDFFLESSEMRAENPGEPTNKEPVHYNNEDIPEDEQTFLRLIASKLKLDLFPLENEQAEAQRLKKIRIKNLG
ncbi:DMBT1 [Branchiostoma lanceolatum]|uniref:DMBT1 protein n=1 Tax=Branchiostoma lanceolatum TaxID=7740 RepID=A0A8K0EFD3_BRALA|nr:DMBT1 [Branchiostoma lanceolatum]